MVYGSQSKLRCKITVALSGKLLCSHKKTTAKGGHGKKQQLGGEGVLIAPSVNVSINVFIKFFTKRSVTKLATSRLRRICPKVYLFSPLSLITHFGIMV